MTPQPFNQSPWFSVRPLVRKYKLQSFFNTLKTTIIYLLIKFILSLAKSYRITNQPFKLFAEFRPITTGILCNMSWPSFLWFIQFGSIWLSCCRSMACVDLSYRGDDTWDKIFFWKNLSLFICKNGWPRPNKADFSIENKVFESIKVQHKKTNQPTHNDRLQSFWDFSWHTIIGLYN